MNEHIAQLAEEATYTMEFNKDSMLLETTSGDITYKIPAEFIEKFAELVIYECVSVTLDYKNDEHYQGWLDHQSEILKYFGFEK